MEARRLAVIRSHIFPLRSGLDPTRIAPLSPSIASSFERDKPDQEQTPNENNSNQRNECVFCRIVRGESPAFKLYEDDTCLCILDSNPLSRGHCLIIPRAHFSSLDVTPPSVISAMCSKVPFLSSAIVKATGSDSFNLLINNGKAAGQVIFHTHIHIIPRKDQDCLWSSESFPRHPLKQDLEASKLVNCVREHLSNDCQDIAGEKSGVGKT